MLRTGFNPQLGIRGNREETKQKKKKIRRTTVVPNLLFAEANHRFGKPFLFFWFVFSSFFFCLSMPQSAFVQIVSVSAPAQKLHSHIK